MQDLIADLFLNNENLDERLEDFLNQNPKYRQLMEKRLSLEHDLLVQMPPEIKSLFFDYEMAANHAQSIECSGHFLFGVKLRQDLREVLWENLK